MLLGFRRLHYRTWISTYRPADCDEFRHVESALAKFEFRHERLTLPKAFPKLYLRNTGVLSGLHKQLDYPLVEIGTK